MKNRTRKSYRSFRSAHALFLVLLVLLASCDMLGVSEREDEEILLSPEGAYLSLSVGGAADSSRTALPQVSAVTEFDSFTLTGSGTDANNNALSLAAHTFAGSGSQSAYSVMSAARIPIEKGTWAFTLTAAKGGASYGGSISGVAIGEGTNALSFTLALTSFDLESGTGDISVTVTYPADSVERVTAGLYTTGGVLASGYTDENVSASGTAMFTQSGVAAGTYLVIFKFYAAGDVPLYVFREYAQVADSLVSISNRSINNMESAYDIEYKYNGGSLEGGSTALASYSRRSGDITLPQLVRTGYRFDGWTTGAEFFDGNTNSTLATGTPVSVIYSGSAGTVILNANWTPITYTIRFVANAESGISGTTADLTATYDKTDALTTNGYTREGYAFVVWNTAEDGSGTNYTNAESRVWNLSSEQGGTVTFYAVWKEADAKYTIRHYLQNVENDSFTEDSSAVQRNVGGVTGEQTAAAPITTYAGFTPQPVTQKEVASDSSTVVEVYYNRNSYTLTYAPNALLLNGMDDTSVSALPEAESRRYQLEKALSAASPTRTGYTFTGWNTQADGGGTSYAAGTLLAMSAAADVTLYAQWTAHTYTVTFDAHGGATASGATTMSQSFTYDAPQELSRAPFAQFTYTGYKLESASAWTANADGTGTVYANGAEVVNLTAEQGGTVTLYAKWVEADTTYTVEHYQQPANGSSTNSEYEKKDTDSLAGKTGENTAASAKNYAGFTAQSFSQTAIAADGSTVVKIYYDRNQYAITFDGNGNTGGATAAQTFRYGVAQSLTANGFTRTGYTFTGWATSATSANQYDDSGSYSIGAENATLYAIWTANQYTVTLSATDATSTGTASVTATYDSAMPAISALPQRTGYTFAGFYSAANGGGTPYYSAAGESLRSWDSAADTTLYANWTEAADTTYTVEHYQQNTTGADYTLVSADTQTLSGTTGAITAAAAKSYAGFTAPTVTQGAINADGSTVVKIYYTRQVFTVTYTAGSGISASGIPSAEPHRYGAAVTVASATPSRSGFAFNGWHLGSDTATTYTSGNTITNAITANLTLTAVWSEVKGVSVSIGNPDLVSAVKNTNGTTITLTLEGASALDSASTKIDGVTATSKTGVSISGNQLVCDTSSWATGSYQVTLCGTVNGTPQSISVTITVN